MGTAVNADDARNRDLGSAAQCIAILSWDQGVSHATANRERAVGTRIVVGIHVRVTDGDIDRPHRARRGGVAGAAQHAKRDPSWQCGPTWPTRTKVNLPGLGVVDQICFGPTRAVRFIDYTKKQSKGPKPLTSYVASGVIFNPTSAMVTSSGLPEEVPDSCVIRINGPCWRFTEANPDCPSGCRGGAGP